MVCPHHASHSTMYCELSLLDLLTLLHRLIGRLSPLSLRQLRWLCCFCRRRRHINGIGLIDALLEPLDCFTQSLAQLGNLACAKNDQYDDQDQQQFHPSKRAEHGAKPLFFRYPVWQQCPSLYERWGTFLKLG